MRSFHYKIPNLQLHHLINVLSGVDAHAEFFVSPVFLLFSRRRNNRATTEIYIHETACCFSFAVSNKRVRN
jgi:hypothetical protein